MKKTTLLILILSLLNVGLFAQRRIVTPRDSVLYKMVIANKYFMEKYSDVGKPMVTIKEYPSNIWTRSVYYEGLMALHTIYPKNEYYEYAVAWGEFHKWGMRHGTETRNADNQCCGQTFIDLYNIDPQPERIRDIKMCMNMLINTPQNDDWWWIDALQMGMPVFAKLGVLLDDDRYFQKMYDIYMYTKTQHGETGLYNTEDHLWWRDKNFKPPYLEPNGEDCYWSRGNGWVYAALVRVLDILPEDAVGRDEYMKTFKEMTIALKKVQRKDGFWNASLHDPNNFGGKETTGTALFTYGMAWGINNGILDKKEYLPIVNKAWDVMAKECVHENGFLGYVQGTGDWPGTGQPVTYDSMPDFEDYGLGCFLLAGSEVYKLR